MRVTLVIGLLAAPLWAAPAEEGACCDDPSHPDEPACCEQPIPPPSVLPPLALPPPTPPPPPVVLLPGVIVGPGPYLPRPPVKKSDDRLFGTLSVGGAYQLMLDESVGGAAIDVSIGGEDRHWGGGAKLGLIAGRISGLTFTWFRIGGGFTWQLGERVRFGFGMGFGVLDVQRAPDTAQHDDMMSPTVGAHLELSVDSKRRQRKGWYVFSKVGGDFVMAVTDLSPAALLLDAGLGYRL